MERADDVQRERHEIVVIGIRECALGVGPDELIGGYIIGATNKKRLILCSVLVALVDLSSALLIYLTASENTDRDQNVQIVVVDGKTYQIPLASTMDWITTALTAMDASAPGAGIAPEIDGRNPPPDMSAGHASLRSPSENLD